MNQSKYKLIKLGGKVSLIEKIFPQKIIHKILGHGCPYRKTRLTYN